MKLISLNAEGAVHTQVILDYLLREQPDVVCLQEVVAASFARYKEQLGFYGVFAPMVTAGPHGIWGVATLSRFPIRHSSAVPYDGFALDYPEFLGTRTERPRATLLIAEIAMEQSLVIVGNTHFTWAPTQTVTSEQKVNLDRLYTVLDNYPELILCGDFNSPRGGSVFDALSQRYTDNVPRMIDSTLDPVMHRVKDKKIVVDGVFSSSRYTAVSSRVVAGLSDHCSIEVTFS